MCLYLILHELSALRWGPLPLGPTLLLTAVTSALAAPPPCNASTTDGCNRAPCGPLRIFVTMIPSAMILPTSTVVIPVSRRGSHSYDLGLGLSLGRVF